MHRTRISWSTLGGLCWGLALAGLLAALASCGPAATTDPLATPAAPQAIEAVVDSNLSNYRIKYYQAVQRETLTVANQAGAPIRETDEPFTVLDHGPVDELPAEVKKPTIYVVFSQPVVPLAQLGKVARSSDVMKIQPALRFWR